MRISRIGAIAALCLSGSAVVLSCGDPVAPGNSLTERVESAHFVYMLAKGDAVDTVFQERHYAWAMQKLGLTTTGKLMYHKYRDRERLEQATGRNTNGFAEERTYDFYTIWPFDNHEYVHAVFTTHVGTPSALFNEGVAVAHHGASISGSFEGDPLWNGSSAHAQVRAMVAAGTLPDLDRLVVNNDFWTFDQQKTYAIAGSFVRYLIDAGGIERFRTFASRSGRDDSASRIKSDFEGVYGESLRTWWTRWIEFLTAT